MKSIQLPNTEHLRLDVALAEMIDATRSQIQRAIKQGLVLVDDQPAVAKLLVNDQNVITYDEAFFGPKQKSDAAPKPLTIIFENKDVIVVNKPAGVLVHDTDTSTEPTLVDSLLQHDPAIAKIGDDPQRPGIVHRLDKAASGVMIVAKTQDAFDHLKTQFKSRKTKKKYTVLVHGEMSKLVGNRSHFPIARSKSHGRMAAKPESQGGKKAITHYTVIKQYPHHALLDVEIMTGRTHQIRAHMFALGHPVAGDTLYRIRGMKPMEIGRIFLHARELTITLPDGETTISSKHRSPKNLNKSFKIFQSYDLRRSPCSHLKDRDTRYALPSVVTLGVENRRSQNTLPKN